MSSTPTFTAHDLGTFGGKYTFAHGVNDHGTVVGASYMPNNKPTAFKTDEAHRLIPLAIAVSPLPYGIRGISYARGINTAGDIVGFVSDPHVGGGTRPFILRSDGTTILLPFSDGAFANDALAINNTGVVVGYSEAIVNAAKISRAFVSKGVSSFIELGTFGGLSSNAQGINDTGIVVGYAQQPADYDRAFRTSEREVWQLIEIGGFSERSNRAYGINNRGAVVGCTEIANTQYATIHAFLMDERGQFIDLGTLGGTSSEAFALSEDGIVVGKSRIPQNQQDRAFLWTSRDGMLDLNTLINNPLEGNHLTYATAISPNGHYIAAQAENNRAYILTRTLPTRCAMRLGRRG